MKTKLLFLMKKMKGVRILYVIAFFCIACASILEFIVPLLVKLTIDWVLGDSAPAGLFSWVVRIGDREYLYDHLYIAGCAVVGCTLAAGGFSFLSTKLTAVAAERTSCTLKDSLYNHIQRLPFSFHARSSSGDLQQRSSSDVETVRKFLSIQLGEIGRALCMIAIALPTLFVLDVTLALISLPVIPVLIGFSLFFFLQVQKRFRISDEAEGELTSVLQENITGVRVIRAFGTERKQLEKYENRNRMYRDKTYILILLMAGYWSISSMLSMLQIGMILVVGSVFALHGDITLGTLVVFLTYQLMLLWPVREMGRILTDMGKALVSLDRIREILIEPEEENRGECCPDISGSIVFDNVSFAYSSGQPVLHDISFRVSAGETVAILGPTGSGKTTLLQLLPALYEYTGGEITLDGAALHTIEKRYLRRCIAYVLQEPFLFGKTVKKNIMLARNTAHEHEVVESARSAHIHDDIQGLLDGYDTEIGERGVTLSGGQKQRIAIARALISNAPILIFDDSLSAVDTQTDASIRKALRKRKDRRTTFIISHRMTTLAEADKILVMNDGRIIQSGTHDSLVAQEGLYRDTWLLQQADSDAIKEEGAAS